MPKTALKIKAIEDGRFIDDLDLTVIDGDLSLLDTHRKTPRAKGGTYTDENTVIGSPEQHMRLHNIWRDREPSLANLKALVDDRKQSMKLLMKVQNQLLAFKRGVDHPDEMTVDWLKSASSIFATEVAMRDRVLAAFMKRYVKESPLATSAMNLRGVGPVTVAYMAVYVDLEKSQHASSVWKYCGLDVPSHERFKKGKSSGGNRNLRTVLYTMADSQVKGRNRENPSSYGYIYDEVKNRLENSSRITKSRFSGDKGVPPREVAWKDTKACHRHGAALRAIMKHFLADYWFVGRTLAGLPTDKGYAVEVLGGTHEWIAPEKRGWKF